MRKIFASLLVCLLLLTACGDKSILIKSGNAPASTRTADTADTAGVLPSPAATGAADTRQPSPAVSAIPLAKVSDYFPLTRDIHMKYKGTGNEYAAFETYVDYSEDNSIQIRKSNGGTVTANVYRLDNGTLKKTFSQGEVYYRYDYTSQSNQEEIILKEPLKEGTSWLLSDGSTRSISAVDRTIKTPAGEYKALEVTTKRQNSTEREYFVKDIGLVKSEFIPAGGSSTITSELEKIEKGLPLRQKVRLYFPEFLKDRVAYIDRDIELFTNEDVLPKLEKELKAVPENSGLSKVLSVNTGILGCSIDDKKGIVTVDFTSRLVSEMNAGISLESMILKSITNTFGDYFQKDKVIITLEGKPYSSGHVLMKPGEYFTVSRDNTAEYGRQ